MKKLLFILIIPFVLVACKKDDPDPEQGIISLVGSWKHTAYGNVVNGETVWVPIEIEPRQISFRFDGLILDSMGLPACCAPKAYYVNGELFEVKPKAKVPINEQCAFVNCISCDTWSIEQTGNELILSYCAPVTTKSKYVRQ
jgi:hypothetical protein